MNLYDKFQNISKIFLNSSRKLLRNAIGNKSKISPDQQFYFSQKVSILIFDKDFYLRQKLDFDKDFNFGQKF